MLVITVFVISITNLNAQVSISKPSLTFGACSFPSNYHQLENIIIIENARDDFSAENFKWLEASISILRNFHQAGGHRVVMAGTCAEYDWNYGYCQEIITPCRPNTPYGVCKNALHELLCSYSKEQKLSSAWGRIFLPYGPDEDDRRLIPSLVSVFKGIRAPFGINLICNISQIF